MTGWTVLRLDEDNLRLVQLKEHGCLPHDIARTLTTRRIYLGHSISSILI